MKFLFLPMDWNECKLPRLQKHGRLRRKWVPYPIHDTCFFSRLRFEELCKDQQKPDQVRIFISLHKEDYLWCQAELDILMKNSSIFTGRIQCEVLTTLPFCFSWIKKFLGQQLKIWDDSLVEKLFR